jgi:hypothetical protein
MFKVKPTNITQIYKVDSDMKWQGGIIAMEV